MFCLVEIQFCFSKEVVTFEINNFGDKFICIFFFSLDDWKSNLYALPQKEHNDKSPTWKKKKLAGLHCGPDLK